MATIELPESVTAILVDGAAPTPPLTDFMDAYRADPNLWWRIGCGHHQNLFEQAVDHLNSQADRIAAAMALVADWRVHGSYAGLVKLPDQITAVLDGPD